MSAPACKLGHPQRYAGFGQMTICDTCDAGPRAGKGTDYVFPNESAAPYILPDGTWTLPRTDPVPIVLKGDQLTPEQLAKLKEAQLEPIAEVTGLSAWLPKDGEPADPYQLRLDEWILFWYGDGGPWPHLNAVVDIP